MTEQRRLAAIVSADVAGYSRLMGRDESGTLAALKALRREIIDPAIASHNGRIVKTTGDGLLLEFASVVDAVRCAIKVQTDVTTQGASTADEHRIAFRIGINIGDIIVDGDDIFGDGVNIAARLQEIATPGGICISSRVHEDVRDRLDVAFEDGGQRSLKNIARPVQVWRWSSGAVPQEPRATPPSLTLPDKPSIAVLPFQNMSGDPEQEYFVDGLVEDIITALSRISWFFVIARNSSFTYKGRSADVRAVGRELGVQYVVEGSVRRAGGRLRVTAQLVEVGVGSHIWADRYDGAVADVFDLQDSITSSIVGAIEPKVQQAEIKRAQAKATTDLTAYDLFLRATALRSEYKEERHREALVLLERAVALDPRFSSAHALMANIYQNFKTQDWASIGEAEAKGLAAASLALETGLDDPLALTRAGTVLSILGRRHEDALAYIERALVLNPNLAVAWRFSGWAHYCLGNFDEAIARFETARRYSPVDRDAFDGYTGIAFAYISLGRYEIALGWAEKAVRELPRWVPAYWAVLASAAMAGRPSEYLSEALGKLRQLEPKTSISGAMRRVPFSAAARETLAAALRRAGMPE